MNTNMNYSGIYLNTSFAEFTPDLSALPKFSDEEYTLGDYIEPQLLTTLLMRASGTLPQNSSEIIHIENHDSVWTIGFAGIPRLGVMLSVLAIMHNDILPFVDCMFTIIFYHGKEDAITMTSVRPEWLPNANTYADVLQYVGRIQHRVY